MSSADQPIERENLVAATIGAAEDIRDPLDGIVEKAATDPGAPFAPDVLERLAALQKDNRPAFELLRAQLKSAGCRVTVLDEAIAEENGDTGGRGPKQADMLIGLAQSAELFHSPDGIGFADLDIDGHRETWPIRSKGFRRWLARRFYAATQGAPSSEALASALNVIEAKAHFDAPEREVYVRVGGLDGRLYLDLGDETWRAVEVDTTGWRVIDNPPVRFRRAAGIQPLPIPVPGGSVETLRYFLNLKTDTDFVLVVAWALACLRDRGPYPVIVLSGEQGSAKSTFSAVLRALLDPNTAPLRALPREDRDLFIAASNGHVLAFDNVSGLPAWISDTLCRLATGGGFAVRQLYTDQDEVLFDASRPVILNGIEDIVTRPDLADRAILLTLEPIPEESRRPEAELWSAFDLECPCILGALLNAVVEGLRRLPETRLPRLPRMADFALWATACETALWPAGTFWMAYCGNRDEAVEGVIDADPVAAAVRAVMAARAVWKGTASDLLRALAEVADERVATSKTWPDSPRALAGRLRRAATFLRKIGIEIGFGREGQARIRTIHITTNHALPGLEQAGVLPSAPSVSRAEIENARKRTKARASRIAMNIEERGSAGRAFYPDHSDEEGHRYRLVDAFGTRSLEFVRSMLNGLGSATADHLLGYDFDPGRPNQVAFNAALAVISGVQPKDEIEAMLAAHMAVTNIALLDLFARTRGSIANHRYEGDGIKRLDVLGNLTNKFMRTYTMQIEALARKRRKGEQNIRVEHVHVYSGGQAIVGSVSHRGGRGYRKNEQQAYERKKAKPATRAIPDSPAVRSPDQERQILPFASDEKGPLSIARRCKR